MITGLYYIPANVRPPSWRWLTPGGPARCDCVSVVVLAPSDPGFPGHLHARRASLGDGTGDPGSSGDRRPFSDARDLKGNGGDTELAADCLGDGDPSTQSRSRRTWLARGRQHHSDVEWPLPILRTPAPGLPHDIRGPRDRAHVPDAAQTVTTGRRRRVRTPRVRRLSETTAHRQRPLLLKHEKAPSLPRLRTSTRSPASLPLSLSAMLGGRCAFGARSGLSLTASG